MNMQEHAAVLRSARRIAVFGCSGGGKSTLSRALAQRLSLPYVSMDREFFWKPGWVLRNSAQSAAMIAEASQRDAWVMDGTSPRTLHSRLNRADAAIWVRMPRALCIRRVLERRVKYAGRTRAEMADDCPERVSLDFLKFIWNFERVEVPKIETVLREHGTDVPLIVLRKPAETAALLAAVDAVL